MFVFKRLIGWISILRPPLVLAGIVGGLIVPIQTAGNTLSITVTPLVTGLAEPVDITHANDESSRLFIVERPGRILIWDGSTLLATPFLDISQLTSNDGERGLLGMAFHPDYTNNGHFFVHYTDLSGDTVVARYTVSTDDNIAEPDSGQIILQVSQPASNHNGGQIRFGPDGFFYIALGDGGFGGDPDNNGQNLNTLLGKLLRINVDGGLPYGIPENNPFIDLPESRPEIWAYGLRNPWRFSFDRVTGDLFIADVGQGGFEEVNFQAALSTGGENYGWRLMEGNSCFNPTTGCNAGNLSLPVIVYDHAVGQSITGGYRYRGRLYPSLEGAYVYGDFITGKIFTAKRLSDGTWDSAEAADTGLRISTFGEDEQGELYLAHFNSGNGAVYQLESDDEPIDTEDSVVVVGFGSGGSGCFFAAADD